MICLLYVYTVQIIHKARDQSFFAHNSMWEYALVLHVHDVRLLKCTRTVTLRLNVFLLHLP